MAACERPPMTIPETTVEFLDAFSPLIDLRHAPRNIAFMDGLIQREIIFRILQSAEGKRLRAIAAMGDVVEWIRDHYAEPLRVEQLLEPTGMGV
jgi:hypothetical protein